MTADSRPAGLLHSTSFKLTAFFVVSCVAIIVLVESVSSLITDRSEKKLRYRSQNRARYSRLLVGELEKSVDPASDARRLEADTEVGVRAEDFGGSTIFATNDKLPTIAEVERVAVRKIWTPELKAGEFHGVAVSVVTAKSHRYLFFFRSTPYQELQLQWISPLMALIVMILFANFILIRWLFRPVTWLSDGIRRLGDGDFAVRVPCRRYDELGDLAVSFNRTVERVRSIVESKRQLLLDVSHELRSPLTRIKVALELDGVRAREQVRKDVVLLDSMIHDLLESARLESFDGALLLEAVDLSEIVASVSTTLRDEKPGIVIRSAGELGVVSVDRKRVATCVKNVLDNALKYSKFQSQPVEVWTERREGGLLRVSVRDFGSGVPAAEAEMIFEPFYRLDKSRIHETGGYGLGLSLCRKIMKAHGGQICVATPATGEGAVFTLDFPIQPPPDAAH